MKDSGNDQTMPIRGHTAEEDPPLLREDIAVAEDWPPVRGDYTVGNPKNRVAVVTLSSRISLEGAAISGPCVTENLGIEKIIANVISNSNIRFLILCGRESRGHLPGDTILALHKNGLDGWGRIVGSKGAIPFIENLPREAISRFQSQVEVVDKIGTVDALEISRLIIEYSSKSDVYPEPPFLVMKRRHVQVPTSATMSDMLFGDGIWLDASLWMVSMTEEM